MLYGRWKNFGFSAEQVARCIPYVRRHNIAGLQTACAACTVMVLLFALFPVFLETDGRQLQFYLAAAFVNLALLFLARRQMRSARYARWPLLLYIILFFYNMAFFGLYAGILANRNTIAVVYVLFLISSQILFVLPPPLNLALNSSAVALFSCFSILLKAPHVWIYDVANIAITALAGTAFSWYISRILLRDILSTLDLEREREEFRRKSTVDALTGLGNRHDYLQTLNVYLTACRRTRQTVCMLMLDVDFFKDYNDHYGHPKGDEALRRIGGSIAAACSDMGAYAARIGGEEFMIIWMENRVREAEREAVRLRSLIENLHIRHEVSSVSPYITASFGLYMVRGGSEEDEQEIYRRVDRALYEAKRQGRNRIVRAENGQFTTLQHTPSPVLHLP